ncbi:MAG: nucleotide-binding protein [Rhodospirillaceae bacterium]
MPMYLYRRPSEAKLMVARFLEKIDLSPIILHEKENEGKTIIEKFEKHSDVGFAIVLLTPDDVGCLSTENPAGLKPRARQNVILELGYFIGKLGRSRVCALKKSDIELPSDYLGVTWTELDAAEGWHKKLIKELRAAGYAIDANKVL